jgi:hypothetical protein
MPELAVSAVLKTCCTSQLVIIFLSDKELKMVIVSVNDLPLLLGTQNVVTPFVALPKNV